jgi:hypothetical protein
MDWIQMAEGGVQWQVEAWGSIKSADFLDQLINSKFLSVGHWILGRSS